MPKKRPNIAPLLPQDVVRRDVGPLATKVKNEEEIDTNPDKGKVIMGLQHTVITDIGETTVETPTTDQETPTGSRSITWRDIVEENELGCGAYGKVVKAHVVTSKGDKRNVAVKKIKGIGGEGVEKELGFLRRSINERTHSNIVKTFQAFTVSDQEVWIVMEYMDKGSLGSLISARGGSRISESVVTSVAFQTLSALNFLHSQKHACLHRDIKPDNLLVNKDGLVKLADFGTAKECETLGAGSTFCGTQLYMSPERLQGKAHDGKSDIWSLGVVLAEMGFGAYPFSEIQNYSNYLDFLQAVSSASSMLRKLHFSPTFISFLELALHASAKDRSNAMSLLQHQFIESCFKDDPDTMRRKSYKIIRAWVREVTSSPKSTGGFR